ncbi:MAG: excalibur calcium-binding domain-containing protein [Chloroflexi bacterium]|nr:excalibur calcium-binding domain-containing protein [Chloroflexota bacterium]
MGPYPATTATPVVIFVTVVVTATPTAPAQEVTRSSSTPASITELLDPENNTVVTPEIEPVPTVPPPRQTPAPSEPTSTTEVVTPAVPATSVATGQPSEAETATPPIPTTSPVTIPTQGAPEPSSTPQPTETAMPTSSIEPVATSTPEPIATASTGFDPFGPDRNCSDFTDWLTAQEFFLAAGGPTDDPHRLDGNNDGIACQSLPGAP